MESVSVSILIKVDSFSFLDCLPGISRVCLSSPHHLFLFDLGEPREIRAVTFSTAFSASFFFFYLFVLPVRLQSGASKIIIYHIVSARFQSVDRDSKYFVWVNVVFFKVQ